MIRVEITEEHREEIAKTLDRIEGMMSRYEEGEITYGELGEQFLMIESQITDVLSMFIDNE